MTLYEKIFMCILFTIFMSMITLLIWVVATLIVDFAVWRQPFTGEYLWSSLRFAAIVGAISGLGMGYDYIRKN